MTNRSQRSFFSFIVFLVVALMGLSTRTTFAQAMTADQIIEKNIAARGGLSAWREIHTMTMTGKMDAGSKQNVQLPFVMQLKRPRMSRLEIEFAGKTALQVYDGTNGWKVRPFLGRKQVEPFTLAETETASEQEQLDGYLIDHEAKGVKVEFQGTEAVEGRTAYKLKLTMKNNQVRHLWVDSQSFLEVKLEGIPRRLDGKMRGVEVYYRDYRSVGGLKIPFVIETVVENVLPSRKINIESVVLNPKLAESAFGKPDISGVRAAN